MSSPASLEPIPQPRDDDAKYRALFLGAADAILVADDQGRYVDANVSAQELLGYDRETLLSLGVADVVARGPAWTEDEYRRYVEEGRWRGELELRHRDGRTIPVEALAAVIPGPDGPIFASFIRDMTLRRQELEALRLLRRAIDSSSQGMLLVDAQVAGYPVVSVNHAFRAATGAVDGAFEDGLDKALAGAGASEGGIRKVLDALRDCAPCAITVGRQLPDRTMAWNDLRFEPVLDDDGRLTHAIAFQSPATERIRSAAQADLATRRLDEILAQVSDGFLALDARWRVRYLNPAAERMLGGSAGDPVGRELWEEFPRLARTGLRDALARAVDGGGPATAVFRLPPQGAWLETRITPTADGLSIFLRDVSDRVQAERDLEDARDAAEESSRLKSALLANMSHELRTPLNAILGYAHLLAEDPGLDDRQREDVARIVESGERLLRLITDLLDLSRIEAGRMELAVEQVDVGELLQGTSRAIQPELRRKGLDLAIQIEPGLPTIAADPLRLSQILLNLASNAVKFTDAGRVTLRAARTPDGVAVSVSDTGPGIPPEELPRIFEAFRQADSTATRRHGGSGLGLAIARELAEMHGGTIETASAVGHGTTFTLLLPLAPPAGEAG